MRCTMKYCFYHNPKRNRCKIRNRYIDDMGVCSGCTVRLTQNTSGERVEYVKQRQSGLIALAAVLEFLKKEE